MLHRPGPIEQVCKRLRNCVSESHSYLRRVRADEDERDGRIATLETRACPRALNWYPSRIATLEAKVIACRRAMLHTYVSEIGYCNLKSWKRFQLLPSSPPRDFVSNGLDASLPGGLDARFVLCIPSG